MRFIILCLAVWRVASLLTRELGPRNVFLRIRVHYGLRYDDDGERIVVPEDGGIGAALACLWCTSVWVAPLVVVVDSYMPIATKLLAISAGAILIEDVINGKSIH